MEQEQILSTLSEQLGQTSLSQRTLNDYIGANLPAEGQEFDFAKHVSFLKSLGGNFSRDVADTVNRQVEEFKKNYKPTPEPIKEEPSKTDDAILKQIEELKGRLDESERKNRENSLRKAVTDKNKSLGISNQNLWNDCVGMTEVTKDDTETSLTDKAKKIYEKKLKEYFGEGATPYGGGKGDSPSFDSKSAKDAREAFKAKMKSRGRL